MNYDEVFADDPNRDLFYNAKGYPANKLVVGWISIENALARLEKGEHYVLLRTNGKELPEGYIPLNKEAFAKAGIELDEELATVDPKMSFDALCKDGGIQRISMLPSIDNDATYLLGPGPREVNLSDLVYGEVLKYRKELSSKHTR